MKAAKNNNLHEKLQPDGGVHGGALSGARHNLQSAPRGAEFILSEQLSSGARSIKLN
jgi:hypothetical protein